MGANSRYKLRRRSRRCLSSEHEFATKRLAVLASGFDEEASGTSVICLLLYSQASLTPYASRNRYRQIAARDVWQEHVRNACGRRRYDEFSVAAEKHVHMNEFGSHFAIVGIAEKEYTSLLRLVAARLRLTPYVFVQICITSNSNR